MSRRWISFAAFILLQVSRAAYAQQVEETLGCAEPDPVPAQAIRYGSHVLCDLVDGTDIDTFSIHMTPGTVVRFNVAGGANLDPKLELFGPGGQPVSLSPDRCSASFGASCAFSADLAPDTAIGAGRYTIIFSDDGADEGGAYQLSVGCLVGSCDSDGVPPADPALAAILYDSPTPDAVNVAVDMDAFEIYAAPGTLLRINIAGGPNLDPLIELFQPSGAPATLIGPSLCNASFGASCAYFAEFVPLDAGVHRLFISDGGTDEGGLYQVSVNCLVGTCDSDGQLPADPAPSPIAFDVPELADVSHATDMDAFEFHGSPNTSVRINVAGGPNLDPRLDLYDPAGQPVALTPASCSAAFGASCSFQTDLAAAIEGTYRLLVSDSGPDEAESYQVSINCLVGACDGDGQPPLDPDPQLIGDDEPVSQLIDVGVDMDGYRFHASSGALVRIHVAGGPNLDPRIELFDPAGQSVTLAAASCGAAFGASCSYMTDVIAPALGVYRLFVSDADTNEAAAYQVSVHCLLGACDSDLDGFLDPDPMPIAYASGPPEPDKTDGVSPGVDADGFSFKGVSGTRIRLVVQGSPNLDPRIDVFSPTGTGVLVTTPSCNASFGASCSTTNDLQLTETGVFRIFVSDEGVNEAGGYNLSITCLVGACDISAPIVPLTCSAGGTTACRDNCKFQDDASQADVGGVGPSAAADGIGDRCQCGDANDDGRVTGADGTAIKRAALNLAPFGAGVGSLPAPEKCDANGGTTGDAVYHCSGQDGTFVQRVSLGLATPGFAQHCVAADGD